MIPSQIEIQILTLSTKNEKEKSVAKGVLRRAQSGEDFSSLVKKFSLESFSENEATPGYCRLANHGEAPKKFSQDIGQLNKSAQEEEERLWVRIKEGEITRKEANKAMEDFIQTLQRRQSSSPIPRGSVASEVGDTAFSLSVGESKLIEIAENQIAQIIKRLS